MMQSSKNRRSGPGSGHGPMGQMRRGEKARNFKKTMRMLVGYLSVYKFRIIVVLIFAIASTVFDIIGPRVLGEATTALFEGVMAEIAGTGGIDFAFIGRILLIMLVLYLFSAAFAYLMGWIMAGVATDISYRFRREISQKINRMPLSYFDKTTQGEVLSRITNDVDTVNQTLNQSLTQIITSTITVIGVLIMMFSISWLMTLVALIIIPLTLATVALIVSRSQVYFKEQQDYLGNVNGHVEEMYGGHRVIKAFNVEERSIEKFEEYNNKLYGVAWKSQFLSGLMMPIMTFIGNLGYVAVVVVGGYLTIQNRISVGDIQAFIQYVRNFNRPLMQLANITNVLQQTAAAAERVFEFLAEPEEVGRQKIRSSWRHWKGMSRSATWYSGMIRRRR
jgi:ATP-binding cassette subfamily B multidrug efflux pump